jgi:hypothetical protein
MEKCHPEELRLSGDEGSANARDGGSFGRRQGGALRMTA